MTKTKYILTYTNQYGEKLALYKHKKIKSRRYRQRLNEEENGLTICLFSSLKKALIEQEALFNYCGDNYEIEEYN